MPTTKKGNEQGGAGPLTWIDKRQRAIDLARLDEIRCLSKERRRAAGREMRGETVAASSPPVNLNHRTEATMQRFLIRKRLSKQQKRQQRPVVAHLWDGADTLCRMASTGGLNLKRYDVVPSSHGARLCLMCQAEAAGAHLDHEMKVALELDEQSGVAGGGAVTAGELEYYDRTTVEPCTCRAREKGLTAPHAPTCLKRLQEERMAARGAAEEALDADQLRRAEK